MGNLTKPRCRGCGAKLPVPVGERVHGEPASHRAWLYRDECGSAIHLCGSRAGHPVASLSSQAWSPENRRYHAHFHCAVPRCDRDDLTWDHIVSKADGGAWERSNLQVLCAFHNQLKGQLSQAEFQRLLGVTW